MATATESIAATSAMWSIGSEVVLMDKQEFKNEKLGFFIDTLEKHGEPVTEFDVGMWGSMVEYIMVDKEYLSKLQQIHGDCAGAFCGYGIAVKDFRHPVIEFEKNNTYIQSEGINQDFGIYDSPDDLLKEHQQEMSCIKAFAYRNLGRHLMNRNVRNIRKTTIAKNYKQLG